MYNECSIVITTINEKTKAVEKFQQNNECKILLVGDKKSKHINDEENLEYLSMSRQAELGFEYFNHCPVNHYSRKNLGYLYAIKYGVDCIYDTDDDNIPMDNWQIPQFSCSQQISSGDRYLNIYNYFSDTHIWPRGYPLHKILTAGKLDIHESDIKHIGVWQGMADDDPDVDAIYRLVIGENTVFKQKSPVYLDKGTYCPFNSQNTFWTKKAFPFLYLPSTTSFRFTDILRGYIAQRLMWEQDMHIGFHEATVVQERNEHDFMIDFRDEVECYLGIETVCDVLDNLVLSPNDTDNLMTVYAELADRRIVDQSELVMLEAWIGDLLEVTQ